MTTTGQVAWCTQCWLTDPSRTSAATEARDEVGD